MGGSMSANEISSDDRPALGGLVAKKHGRRQLLKRRSQCINPGVSIATLPQNQPRHDDETCGKEPSLSAAKPVAIKQIAHKPEIELQREPVPLNKRSCNEAFGDTKTASLGHRLNQSNETASRGISLPTPKLAATKQISQKPDQKSELVRKLDIDMKIDMTPKARRKSIPSPVQVIDISTRTVTKTVNGPEARSISCQEATPSHMLADHLVPLGQPTEIENFWSEGTCWGEVSEDECVAEREKRLKQKHGDGRCSQPFSLTFTKEASGVEWPAWGKLLSYNPPIIGPPWAEAQAPQPIIETIEQQVKLDGPDREELSEPPRRLRPNRGARPRIIESPSSLAAGEAMDAEERPRKKMKTKPRSSRPARKDGGVFQIIKVSGSRADLFAKLW